MRRALVAVGAVLLLGFWGCGGDEFSEPAQGAGGQAGIDGGAGQGGQAGSSGSSGQSGAAGKAGASGKGGEAGQGGGGATAGEACDQYAKAYCSRYEACAPALMTMIYGSADMCIKRLKPVCIEALGLQGTTKTPEFASQCAAALSNYACSSLVVREYPDECKPQPGPRQEGESCGEEGQCATRYCKYEAAQGCGVCRNRASAGGICQVDSDCNAGLACTKDGKCVPYGAIEAACNAGDMPCAPGLSCMGAAGTATGKCQKARSGGEECEIAATTKPGCDLLQGLYCTLTGICKKAQFAGTGEACGAITGGYALCSASGKCSPAGAVGTCLAAAADGDACDSEAGPYCMPLAQCIEKTCTPPALSSCK